MDQTSSSAAVDQQQLPPERIQEMRKAIHQHLQQSNVYNQIRDIIDSYAADHADFDPANPSDVMHVLRERGLVQDILGRLGSGGTVNGSAATTSASQNVNTSARRSFSGLVTGQKYLHVRVLGGRAFLDNLDADPSTLTTQQMVLSMHFGHQRFRCTPQECLVDPPFDDDFLIEIDPRGPPLLDITTPLNIVVTKEDCSLARAKCVGENAVEWRKVLKTGYLGLTVELAGENPGVPAGIVELQIEVIPGGQRLIEDEIVSKIQVQKAAITAADREFLIYARRWWSEFHAIRPTHHERKVKLFAATAAGRMVPSTHFVSVLQPDRVLDSPCVAARFVSLLALANANGEDGGMDFAPRGTTSGDVWPSPLNFLAQRKGEICNHATLLCSLLLGFGLDAYCVVGTTTQGKTHMFVCTRRRLSTSASSNTTDYEVTFWEPSTGVRTLQNGPHFYLTAGCCFNHNTFYANIQASENAVTTSFDLNCEESWKQLNPLKLRMVPKFPNPPLLWIPMDARKIEIDIEAAVRKILSEQREGEGLRTSFDDSLSFAIAQALAAYEEQRVTGVAPELSLFHQCVKGKIGDGKTFKGVPLNTSHISARKILASFNGTPSGRELTTIVGEDLKFAIRAKVIVYPESVVSVWVMLAAYYRATP